MQKEMTAGFDLDQMVDIEEALCELQRLRAEKREDECLDKILRNAAERARGK